MANPSLYIKINGTRWLPVKFYTSIFNNSLRIYPKFWIDGIEYTVSEPINGSMKLRGQFSIDDTDEQTTAWLTRNQASISLADKECEDMEDDLPRFILEYVERNATIDDDFIADLSALYTQMLKIKEIRSYLRGIANKKKRFQDINETYTDGNYYDESIHRHLNELADARRRTLEVRDQRIKEVESLLEKIKEQAAHYDGTNEIAERLALYIVQIDTTRAEARRKREEFHTEETVHICHYERSFILQDGDVCQFAGGLGCWTSGQPPKVIGDVVRGRDEKVDCKEETMTLYRPFRNMLIRTIHTDSVFRISVDDQLLYIGMAQTFSAINCLTGELSEPRKWEDVGLQDMSASTFFLVRGQTLVRIDGNHINVVDLESKYDPWRYGWTEPFLSVNICEGEMYASTKEYMHVINLSARQPMRSFVMPENFDRHHVIMELAMWRDCFVIARDHCFVFMNREGVITRRVETMQELPCFFNMFTRGNRIMGTHITDPGRLKIVFWTVDGMQEFGEFEINIGIFPYTARGRNGELYHLNSNSIDVYV